MLGLSGTGHKPHLGLSFTSHDFGPCALWQPGMPTTSQVLRLTNTDSQPIAVDPQLEGVCACVRACMCVFVSACVHVCACERVCEYVHVCVCMRAHLGVQPCMCGGMCVHCTVVCCRQVAPG